MKGKEARAKLGPDTRSYSIVPRADHPDRLEREQPVEAGFRCRECDRPWIIFAFEGEPLDGSNPRDCRFCGAGNARRIR